MSRHWKPEGNIIRVDWSRTESYVRGARRSWPSGAIVGVVLVAAACIGFAYGYFEVAGQRQPIDPSAIEWNEVQAVPTRAPDAEDVAWEKRAEEADAPVIANPAAPGDTIQDAPSARVVRGAAEQPGSPRASIARNGRIYVIDGDTFGIGRQHIRILGLDAPETHPSRCAQEAQLGNAATQKLKELLGSGTVTMSGSGHDQYGRELRQVFVNGVDVADVMIGAGLARSYDGGKKQGWCG